MTEHTPEYNRNDETEQADEQRVAAERDPNENNLPDEVLVDSHTKLAHEDLAIESEAQAEARETRDGKDFEGQPSAAELREERVEESKDN